MKQLAVLLALMTAVPAWAEDRLGVITAWAKNIEFAEDFLRFVADLNAAGRGVVRIDYLGGPEVIPQRQMVYALKRGVVDMYFGAATYTIGLAPESDAFLGTSITPMEARRNGAYEAIEAIWNEKLNAHFLGWHQTGPRLHIFMRDVPKLRADGLPDVAGLRVRTTPTYRAFLEAMGTTPIDIPSSDVYTALERGTVQAIAWSATSLATEGFQNFVKTRIEPGVLGYAMTLQANMDAWRRLSPESRALIEREAERYERESRERFMAYAEQERRALAADGVRGFELSPEAAKTYQALAVEAVWARMAETAPASAAKLRPLFDPR